MLQALINPAVKGVFGVSLPAMALVSAESKCAYDEQAHNILAAGD